MADLVLSMTLPADLERTIATLKKALETIQQLPRLDVPNDVMSRAHLRVVLLDAAVEASSVAARLQGAAEKIGQTPQPPSYGTLNELFEDRERRKK